MRKFGDKYVKRYKRLEADAEKESLKRDRVSILSCYNNVIQWRNLFAHQGQVPSTASYQEVIEAYEAGKEIIHCLAMAMTR